MDFLERVWQEDKGTGASLERLRELGLVMLEKRRLIGDLINVYKSQVAGCKDDGARLFSLVPSGRVRGKGHKLKNGKTIFFTMRVVKLWNTVCQHNKDMDLLEQVQRRATKTV